MIVEISLDIRRPSYALLCQPDIDHIHCKNKLNRSNQYLVTNVFRCQDFLAAPIVPINLATCAVLYL